MARRGGLGRGVLPRGLLGRGRTVVAPAGSTGRLDADEEVLAVAALTTGHLVATRLGLWVPGDEATGPERVPWHLVSSAAWSGTELDLLVAEEVGRAGRAVLLSDAMRRVYRPVEPGRVPQVVSARVTDTVRSAHRQTLPGGAAWFVQRRVPGQDGVVLQVRIEPGTDTAVLRDVAATVAERLPRPS